jgi:hypothetical protein
MEKPVYEETAEKMMVKFGAGLDSDKDGIKSVSFGAFIEVDKKEAMNEAIQGILASEKAPEWLKNIVKAQGV